MDRNAGLVDRTVGLVDMGGDVDVGWTWAEMSRWLEAGRWGRKKYRCGC